MFPSQRLGEKREKEKEGRWGGDEMGWKQTKRMN